MFTDKQVLIREKRDGNTAKKKTVSNRNNDTNNSSSPQFYLPIKNAQQHYTTGRFHSPAYLTPNNGKQDKTEDCTGNYKRTRTPKATRRSCTESEWNWFSNCA